MRSKSDFGPTVIFVALFSLVAGSVCPAVSSKVTRHSSSSDLLKGETKRVVIGSRGTIQLGRAAESVIKEFKDFADVWSVNTIVLSGGTIYFGTSPNGGIYKYSLNKVTKIYPLQTDAPLHQDARVAGQGRGAFLERAHLRDGNRRGGQIVGRHQRQKMQAVPFRRRQDGGSLRAGGRQLHLCDSDRRRRQYLPGHRA